MAKIRTIKPEFWDDEKLAELPLQARLFYIGLWSFADDFGVFPDSIKWAKAKVFPYDNFRDSDLSNWLDALVKNRMIVRFVLNNKAYLAIRRFRAHQFIDKRYERSIVSKEEMPALCEILGNLEYTESAPSVPIETPALYLVGVVEGNGSKNTEPNGSRETVVSRPGKSVKLLKVSDESDLEKQYDELSKSFESKDRKEIYSDLKDFIESHRPGFLLPYVDAWNLIVDRLGLAKVVGLTDERKRKIRIRSRELSFDFFTIMAIVRKDKFYLGDNGRDSAWKIDFDYIIHSESNYVKILEREQKK